MVGNFLFVAGNLGLKAWSCHFLCSSSNLIMGNHRECYK